MQGTEGRCPSSRHDQPRKASLESLAQLPGDARFIETSLATLTKRDLHHVGSRLPTILPRPHSRPTSPLPPNALSSRQSAATNHPQLGITKRERISRPTWRRACYFRIGRYAKLMLPLRDTQIFTKPIHACVSLMLLAGVGNTTFAQQAVSARPVRVGPAPVFFAGPGVVAPELVPRESPVERISPCVKVNGTTVLSATVDSYGRAYSASILKSAEPDLDLKALSILASDRFKPGMHNGSQADIAVEVEVGIQGCMYGKRMSGSWENVVSLLSPPEQSVTVRQQPGQAESNKQPNRAVGGTAPHPDPEPTFAPKLLKKVPPQYPTDAREANITGECLVRVTLDEEGVPHDPQLVRGIVPSLD